MKAGKTIELPVHLTDNVGANQSYADQVAFAAAGWGLSVDVDQTPVVVSYTVEDKGGGWHIIRFTATTGDYLIQVTVPSGYLSSQEFWAVYVYSNDIDTVISFVSTGSDLTPITLDLADQSIGNLVEGDAFATGSITVPLLRLSPFGLSDLTNCTISAAFRKDPDATPVPITATIDDAANRIISAKADTFPIGMALDAGEQSVPWYLDIQIKHTPTGRIITVARYRVDVIWQRDETT